MRKIILSAGAFASLAAAPPPPSPIEAVTQRHARPDAPGCAVATRSGESVEQAAFGQAELEHPIANTPLTIFEAGSVAKQFTAGAALLLVADGKLKLDDDMDL